MFSYGAIIILWFQTLSLSTDVKYLHIICSTGDGICILQAVLMDNLIEACVILKRSSGVTKTPGK